MVTPTYRGCTYFVGAARAYGGGGSKNGIFINIFTRLHSTMYSMYPSGCRLLPLVPIKYILIIVECIPTLKTYNNIIFSPIDFLKTMMIGSRAFIVLI